MEEKQKYVEEKIKELLENRSFKNKKEENCYIKGYTVYLNMIWDIQNIQPMPIEIFSEKWKNHSNK